VAPDSESISRVTPGGQLHVSASGLTAVLGISFDHEGRLYALETDTVPGFPGPAAASSGMVVWVNEDGTLTAIASLLVLPTAMTFGPDGALHVSNLGFGVPFPGVGQVVHIDVPNGDPGTVMAAAHQDVGPAFSPPQRGSAAAAGEPLAATGAAPPVGAVEPRAADLLFGAAGHADQRDDALVWLEPGSVDIGSHP
jgi:hypothetical protein